MADDTKKFNIILQIFIAEVDEIWSAKKSVRSQVCSDIINNRSFLKFILHIIRKAQEISSPAERLLNLDINVICLNTLSVAQTVKRRTRFSKKRPLQGVGTYAEGATIEINRQLNKLRNIQKLKRWLARIEDLVCQYVFTKL
jgi:hypothetical protein